MNPTSEAVGVSGVGFGPETVRRGALAGVVVAGSAVAAMATAQVVVGWQESFTSEALSPLGYAAQIAGLVAMLLVVAARSGDRVTGHAIALFAALMFLPVMHKHAPVLPGVATLYLANVVLVVVLSIATVRRAVDVLQARDER